MPGASSVWLGEVGMVCVSAAIRIATGQTSPRYSPAMLQDARRTDASSALPAASRILGCGPKSESAHVPPVNMDIACLIVATLSWLTGENHAQTVSLPDSCDRSTRTCLPGSIGKHACRPMASSFCRTSTAGLVTPPPTRNESAGSVAAKIRDGRVASPRSCSAASPTAGSSSRRRKSTAPEKTCCHP